jgi:hypothetical protein
MSYSIFHSLTSYQSLKKFLADGDANTLKYFSLIFEGTAKSLVIEWDNARRYKYSLKKTLQE